MNEQGIDRLAKGAIAGLIGGIVASFVMEKFQAKLSELTADKKPSGKKEEEPATVKAAEEISEDVFGHELTKEEKGPAGEVMHYAMGAASGIIYGIAAEVEPVTTIGVGIPFGASVWLIADEGLVPAAGFAKPPSEYPLSVHLSALASHLVYGITTEIVRSGIRKIIK